jgi:hypothetical protein
MSEVLEFLKAKADLNLDDKVDAADLRLAIVMMQADAEKLNKAATPLGVVLIAFVMGSIAGVLGHMAWSWWLTVRIFS